MKDSERLAQLMDLWLRRPLENRTEKDLLAFHGWLHEHRPELLKRGRGDPYKWLDLDLAGHIKRRTRKEMSDTAAEQRKRVEKMRNTTKTITGGVKAPRERRSA